MTQPKAFMFDMDGLLLDTERVYLEVGVPLLAEFGLAEDAATAFFISLVGSASSYTQARLAEVAGGPAEGRAFYDAWRAAYAARLADGIPLRPTVDKALPALAATGARMIVVTSTKGDTARHHLAAAGLDQFFETVIGGDEVPANKPDPAPYLLGAEALSLPPDDCAAFEDSDRGITSAVRAGCIATQIPDLRPQGAPLPPLGQRTAPDLWQALRSLQAI